MHDGSSERGDDEVRGRVEVGQVAALVDVVVGARFDADFVVVEVDGG